LIEASYAHHSAQLQGARLLGAGNFDGTAVGRFGFVPVGPPGEEQLAAQTVELGVPPALIVCA